MNWIDEWLLLWPEGVQTQGVNIRSKADQCTNKMLKLCKAHPEYTKATIFAATKKYLAEREADNWKFTKRAMYFIDKLGEGSLLGTYCEKILRPAILAEDLVKYYPIDDFI